MNDSESNNETVKHVKMGFRVIYKASWIDLMSFHEIYTSCSRAKIILTPLSTRANERL